MDALYVVRRSDDWLFRYDVYADHGRLTVGCAVTLWGAKWIIRRLKRSAARRHAEPVYTEDAD